MSGKKKAGIGCLGIVGALLFLAVVIAVLTPSPDDSQQAAAPTASRTASPSTPTPVASTPTPLQPPTSAPASPTPTAVLPTSTPMPTTPPPPPTPTSVQPTVNLAPSIVHSGTGSTIGGQIDLPAGVYQIHFMVTSNDRRFAPDTYKLTLISRSGGDARVTIKGSDANARHSVRYYNFRDDRLSFEIDVGEKGVWLVEIVETSEALPTPLPATPTPIPTAEPQPTPESPPTPIATLPPVPTPTAAAAATVTPAPTSQPTSTPTPTRAPQYYEVAPDDTLSGIADRFGTTIDELVQANGIDNPNVIQVGDTLIIPPARTSRERAASPSPTPTATREPDPTPTRESEDEAFRRRGFHCLSAWDGNHDGLEALIRDQLNDPGSMETHNTFIAPLDETGFHAIRLEFSAKNAFGGRVRHTAWGFIDHKTCEAVLIGIE